MNNRKERHTCESCLHEEVCEWAVYKASIICDTYIDKMDYKRPVGEWLPNYTSQFCNPGRHCSLCGKVVEFSENFCPKCGAKMVIDE